MSLQRLLILTLRQWSWVISRPLSSISRVTYIITGPKSSCLF